MAPKKHTELLKQLGAPLRLPMQSWGSVRADGIVFLVPWLHDVCKISNCQYVRITDKNKYLGDTHFGARERLTHIDLIRNGAQAYLLIAIAKDKDADRRQVKELSRDDEVFVGEELIEHDGEWWIKLGKTRPLKDLKLSQTAD